MRRAHMLAPRLIRAVETVADAASRPCIMDQAMHDAREATLVNR